MARLLPKIASARLARIGAILGLLLGFGSRVTAAMDSSEQGRPVIRNFTPRDYQAHNQVFTVVEGSTGLMYFGIYGVVMEYDGRSFRKIAVPTSWIRGLAAAPDGSIYVAASDEFGVCVPGRDGLPVYRSLTDRLETKHRPIGNVWSVTWHDGAAWFATGRLVVRIQGEETRVWEFSSPGRTRLGSHGGELYLRRQGDDIRALRDRIAKERNASGGSDPLVSALETLAHTYQMERIRQLLDGAIAATTPVSP